MRIIERQSVLAAALMLAALAVPALSPAAGQETQQEERPEQPQEQQQMENQQATENNLLAVAESKSELSTFVRAVRQAGLASELQTNGPYTVFAPTNEAFQSHFDEQQLQRLLGEGGAAGGQAAGQQETGQEETGQEAGQEYDTGGQATQQDRVELLRFVRGHIVPGEWTSDRLQGVQSLRDVLGQQIAVSGGMAGRQPTAAPGEEQPQEGEQPAQDQPTDPSGEQQTMANPGQLTIGQASVVEMDLQADNGILHVLDGVVTSEAGTGQGQGGGETWNEEQDQPQPEPQPEPQPQPEPAPDSVSTDG